MPQVRCPQCGAVTDAAAPDYPFCIGCQDNLAKCGYCRWFDQEGGVCLNSSVAGLFDPAPDATPPCDQHSPGDLVLVRSGSSFPLAALGVLAAVLVLVYAVLVLREPALPARAVAPHVLQVAMETSGHAAVGRPYVVPIELQNEAEYTVNGVRVQISKDSLRHFTLQQVVPREDATEDEHGGDWRTLIYPPLLKHETQRLNLYLWPRKAGTYHLKVRLLSGGTEYQSEADLPITVDRADAPSLRRAPAPEVEESKSRRQAGDPAGLARQTAAAHGV